MRITQGANYWTGTHNGAGSFTTTQSTVTADFSGDPTWQFTIPTAQLAEDFTNGQAYTFQARAWDVAGSTTSFTGAVTATYDVDVPTGVVVVPATYMNSGQTSITGTAIDNISGATLVEVALSSDSAGVAGSWYNGTGFTGNLGDANVWRSTNSWTDLGSGQVRWSWTRPALEDAKFYSIVLRITDIAGNVKTMDVSERSNFLYDGAVPSIAFFEPDANYEKSLPIVSGQASGWNDLHLECADSDLNGRT